MTPTAIARQTAFASVTAMVQAYRANPLQFTNPLYEFVVCTYEEEEPVLFPDPIGKMILARMVAPVGRDIYGVLPHPEIKLLDETSYNTMCFQAMFHCPTYQRGESREFTLVNPARVKKEFERYLLVSKGLLHLKR